MSLHKDTPVRTTPQTIYLVGFPASGKTTAGKKLKTLLHLPLFDLDKEIEKTSGLTIPEIFEKHGEEHFRKLEARRLRDTELQHSVVSTGGGTPVFNQNMDFMLATGIVIYLTLPVEDLIARLIKSKSKRPLFDELPSKALREKVTEMYKKRHPEYSRAHIQYPAKNLKSDSLEGLKSLIISTYQ